MRADATAAAFFLALATPLAAIADDPSIPATGDACPELEGFDRLVLGFLRERGAFGAALAVVKDGRLVLARGYGWADRERKRPVEPASRFRIASLSKPITAAAVMQLVDRGKLKIEDRIAALLRIEPHLEDGAAPDPRLQAVTLLQLLQHRAGFDRALSFDPMFRPIEIASALGAAPPARPEHIIRYVWGRRLDFDPGARYAYSNIGYCLLGRAIEKASGRSYERYVQEEVLAPLGIRDLRVGSTLPAGRAEDEVDYDDDRTGPAVLGEIGKPVPRPDGAFYLEAMDAHGGWIASAPSLARFAAAFDDPERCPILSAASVRRTFAAPEAAAEVPKEGDGEDEDRGSYYACGWMVRPKGGDRANHWHTGSLPGTSTLMVRRHDGLAWVILFNQRGPEGANSNHAHAIDRLLHPVADAVERWPERDLFPKYLAPAAPPAKETR
jgi:N-acyl-D-amino-acid deacylase